MTVSTEKRGLLTILSFLLTILGLLIILNVINGVECDRLGRTYIIHGLHGHCVQSFSPDGWGEF